MRFFSRVGALVLALYSVSCSTDFKQIGNACFCRADSKDTKDTAHDCDCDAMSALSAVYLGRGLEPAASIVMYDPDDDPSFVCLFEDVSVGQEMECLAGSVGHFSKKIVFSIESGDGEICEGTLDTSCSSQLLDSKGENEEGEGCEALRFVVTGYVGADGRVCDDGYAPCDCDAAMAQQSKDSKHDGTEETETHSNSDSADIDADSQSDDDDVDGAGEGDEDGEQDSYDETSTTSWSEPWTSSTTTTSTTSTTTTSSIDTSDESNDDNEDNDDNDWALRLSQYVHSMKNTDTDSTSTTDSPSSASTSKSESSDESSASDDSDSESDSDSQFMTTATSSDSSSDDDDDESASSNISGQGSSSSDSDSNSNEDTDDDDDDDDDMYDDDDKDDDDDSIDESYDDDSASSGGTTDNASDSTTDSGGSSSSESESHSESEVVSEYEIADSNSDELDSEIGDSDDAAYTETDSRGDSDSQIESDSDSNAIATGTFGLITRLGMDGGGFGGGIETTEDDSHSAGYAADVGSFAAAPKMWADSTDTTPYEKYSFYTLMAILLLNVTAFGWCLCTRARTGKRTERKSLDGVEYAQGKLTEKIEIMEEAADDTDDDETEEEDEDEVFTD